MINIDLGDLKLFDCLSGYEIGKHIANDYILPNLVGDDINVITIPDSINFVTDSFIDGLEEVLQDNNDIISINSNSSINKQINDRLGWRIYEECDLPDVYRGYKGALKMIHDIGVDYDGAGTVDSLKSLVDDLVGISRDALAQGKLFDGLK